MTKGTGNKTEMSINWDYSEKAKRCPKAYKIVKGQYLRGGRGVKNIFGK